MLCEQMGLLRHLVVEHPEALEEEVWSGHFEECAECREEWEAYMHSLAIFRQLESERVSRLPAAPSWEKFSATIREKSSWGGRVGAWRRSLTAAAAAVAIMAGGASWFAWSGSGGEAPETALETSQEKAQVEKPAPSEKWIVTPEQLRVVARRGGRRGGAPRASGATVGDQRPVVFEISLDLPSARTLQKRPERLGGSVSFNFDEARQSLRNGADERGEWQPPLATPVLSRSSGLQLPASFRPSR